MAKKKKTEAEPAAPSRTVDILKKVQSIPGLMTLDSTKIENVPRISTGILSLDLALGGGYPHGRIIEFFGSEGSGKTTATLHAIVAAQRNGGVAAFIDAEHALDKAYAARIGVNFSDLLFGQPDSGEEGLEMVDALCSNMKGGDLVVIDSVANLVPKVELDGDYGDSHVGLQARMMSQAMRKMTSLVSKRGVTVIFINQIRMKIGVMFGSNETTTGGRALKFYATQRIEVKPMGRSKAGDTIIGMKARFKVVKNKVAPPFREAEVELRFGQGFPRSLDLLRVGSTGNVGVIEKAGAWYSYKSERLGQGIENSAVTLEANPALMAKIEQEVLERYEKI